LIKVLVVEDSAVVRELLSHILSSDPEIQVVATAADGDEAIEAVERTRPDAITMDIHMPRMDGFDATRRIMETRPTPIVIVSGAADIAEQTMAFRAMQAGALAALPRPAGIGHPNHQRTAAELVQTVKLMSEVKLVRRWARQQQPKPVSVAPPLIPPAADVAVIAIGASTGGPQALQTIVSQLPAGFQIPILVVQHIANGFAQGFADWLGQSANLPVRIARHQETMQPGHIYVAADGYHLKVGNRGHLLLTQDQMENGLRPSVACLFRSVAAVYHANAAGVLLTGMGKDGAHELKLMKDQGALTIAQDRESSVIHGMPGEAIRLNGATYVLPPDKIASLLVSFAMRPPTEKTGNEDLWQSEKPVPQSRLKY
jgi:two-component system, chemotaxis family, protein-glutamate methylesterase/glutaminase